MNDDEILKMFRKIDAKLDRIQASLNAKFEDHEARLKHVEWSNEVLTELVK